MFTASTLARCSALPRLPCGVGSCLLLSLGFGGRSRPVLMLVVTTDGQSPCEASIPS